MPSKIWTAYPFDITDGGNGRRVLIVAPSVGPAAVREEAHRLKWGKVQHVHIVCQDAANAFALGFELNEMQASGEMPDANIIVNGIEVDRAE